MFSSRELGKDITCRSALYQKTLKVREGGATRGIERILFLRDERPFWHALTQKQEVQEGERGNLKIAGPDLIKLREFGKMTKKNQKDQSQKKTPR